VNPIDAYAIGLSGARLTVRRTDGGATPLPVHRWLGDATAADLTAIERAEGPVLDLGCGPGRLLDALHSRGVPAVGVDASPHAACLARRRGATIVEGSLFGDVPAAGRWRTALLLDGNVGIGGAPVRLLSRVRALLGDGGCALVEVDPPGSPTRVERVRLECEDVISDWFAWSRVGRDGVGSIAAAAGLSVSESWSHSGRCFVRLEAR
jgi:SAM-dependent methyltransferase